MGQKAKKRTDSGINPRLRAVRAERFAAPPEAPCAYFRSAGRLFRKRLVLIPEAQGASGRHGTDLFPPPSTALESRQFPITPKPCCPCHTEITENTETMSPSRRHL